MRFFPMRHLAAASILALTATLAQAATPSTATGQISVAQVMSMLEQAQGNPTAAQVLQAYLGGVGETAGVLISATDAAGPMSAASAPWRSMPQRCARP